MPAREHLLHKIRTALGRSAGQPVPAAPAALLDLPPMDPGERLSRMLERFPGQTFRAAGPAEARDHVAGLIGARRAVASPAPLLEQLGILALPGVQAVSGEPAQVREACAAAEVGITTADYGLADTGALVALAAGTESRLASLLPPVHIAVLPADRILTGLGELFTILPDPGALSSSMVLIGGPSRTADIEQILTLGVHGPRELHLVCLVDQK